MRRLFQDFADGEYDRPNQRWVCGQADESCSCPFGPTARGACPEMPECKPVKQDGRWRCSRPATRGGSCESEHGGPTPDGVCCRVGSCKPRLSLRARRGRLVLGAALLAAGLLALVMGSPLQTEALAPGPLSQSHAQLLARGDWENRCAACHVQNDRPLLTLAIGNLVGLQRQGPTQSDLCMKCHEKHIDPGAFLLAHGQPAGRLEGSDGRQVGCSTCHQEHHGAGHDLTTLTSGRCQACHKEQYDSFAGGHPDFGAWPHRRRTRIAFDHVSHVKKHFPEKKHAFTCSNCHVEGPANEAMLMADYEATCAECHNGGIHTSAGAGLALLSLPTLDLEVLAEHGQELERWPDSANGDFDGEMPALLKLLLADRPALTSLLQKYGAGFSFFDIDPDSPDDVRHAAKLARDISRLMESLKTKGQAALTERLQEALGRELSASESAALTAGLPVDLVEQAILDWPAGRTRADAPIEKVKKHPAGGWFKSDSTLSLRYVPAGHADPLLRSWIDLIVTLDDARKLVRESAIAELATANSPGQCLMCHSTEVDPAGRMLVNWRPLNPVTEPRGFTRFSHGPHTTIKELADCESCHRLDETANSSASYASLDPKAFVSHFLPITKADCAECHTPHAAGNSCVQCHNYHVDPKTLLEPKSPTRP